MCCGYSKEPSHICFGREIKKIVFQFELLSGALRYALLLSQTGLIFEPLFLINDTNGVGHSYTCYYRDNRHFTDIKSILIKTSSFFKIFHFVIVSILVE